MAQINLLSAGSEQIDGNISVDPVSVYCSYNSKMSRLSSNFVLIIQDVRSILLHLSVYFI
jgi:hypothetical protein